MSLSLGDSKKQIKQFNGKKYNLNCVNSSFEFVLIWLVRGVQCDTFGTKGDENKSNIQYMVECTRELYVQRNNIIIIYIVFGRLVLKTKTSSSVLSFHFFFCFWTNDFACYFVILCMTKSTEIGFLSWMALGDVDENGGIKRTCTQTHGK